MSSTMSLPPSTLTRRTRPGALAPAPRLSPSAAAEVHWSRRATDSVHRITELVARHLQVARCSVWVMAPDGTQAQCVDMFVRESNRHIREGTRSTAELPALFRALEEKGQLAVPVAEDLASSGQRLRNERYLPLGVSAVLAVALRRETRLSTLLIAEQTGPARAWNEDELRFVHAVAVTLREVVGDDEPNRVTRIDRRFVDGLPIVAYRCGLTDTGWIVSDVSEGAERLLGQPAVHFIGGRIEAMRRALTDQWPAQEEGKPTDLPRDLPTFDYRYTRTAPNGSVREFVEKGSVSVDPQTQAPVIDGVIIELARPARGAARAEAVPGGGNLLTQVSDELRTPLNTILGFADLLDKEPVAEPGHRHDYIAQIQRAGHYLLGLIAETMDLSRIESGVVTLDVQALELAPLVESCVAQVRAQADPAGIEIRNLVELEGVPRIQVDPRRMRQVLVNLLSNAVKFNRPGGSVDIESRSDGERVQLLITDTGVGMHEEQIAELFQPFNRLAAGHHEGGLGQGLVITRRLIEAMGAQISVSSEPSVGTTFELSLPPAEGLLS